jgi:hypothetical protein
MNIFLVAFAVFVCAILVDVLWTLYIQSVNDKKAFFAALWSGMIFLAGGVNVIAYTKQPILLLAAALGGFVGTYITVRFKKT